MRPTFCAMPGKPDDDIPRQADDQTENGENADRPTQTDRLNKYLLCAYLNRLNEEDRRGGGNNDADGEESTNARGETLNNRDGDGF